MRRRTNAREQRIPQWNPISESESRGNPEQAVEVVRLQLAPDARVEVHERDVTRALLGTSGDLLEQLGERETAAVLANQRILAVVRAMSAALAGHSDRGERKAGEGRGTAGTHAGRLSAMTPGEASFEFVRDDEKTIAKLVGCDPSSLLQ
jgi:hypothetical protein